MAVQIGKDDDAIGYPANQWGFNEQNKIVHPASGDSHVVVLGSNTHFYCLDKT